MGETATRTLALLSLLQTAVRLVRVPTWPTGSASPTGPSATTSPAPRARLPGARGARAGRSLPAGRRREAAAAAARRRGGRGGRRRSTGGDRGRRRRGDQRPGARQARAGAAGPAAPQAQRARSRRRPPARSTPTATSRTPRSTPPSSKRISLAIRDHDGIRCDYRDEPLEIEPYHLVAWQRRWYLVARDPRTDAWAPYRVDWLRLKTPGGRRFAPAEFPGDLTEFVVREVARTGWAVHARIRIDAPATRCWRASTPPSARSSRTRRRQRPGHRWRQPRGRRGVDLDARHAVPRQRAAGAGRARARARAERYAAALP